MFICNPPLTGSDIFVSSGTYNKPTIVYNDGEGTVTIGAGKYRVFLTEDYSGRVAEFTLPGGTFAIGDNIESYLCVNYNNGSPLMYVETDESLIDDSSSVLVYTCSRIGTAASGFSYLDWDEEAKSLPNKLIHKDVESQRFLRVYGLDISVDSNRTVISTAGEVFTGVMERYFPEANSTTDECFLRVKDGTGWIRTAVTTYPNDKYDSGGTGLVDLTDGQYGVVWIYRDMGTDARIHFIMGRDSYTTVANAKTAPQPSDIDNLMRLDTILLTQVIFLKGQNIPTEINSAFSIQFAPSIATVHNGLGGLQGGYPLEGEFYHASLEKYTVLNNTSGINTGDETRETIVTKIGYDPLESNGITAGTHTKIQYDEDGLVVTGTDATTADIDDSVDRRYVTDTEHINYNKIISVINNAVKAVLYSNTNDTQTFTQTTNYQKINLTLIADSIAGFTYDTINKRLVYAGVTKRVFFNGAANLFNCTTNNTVITFRVYKNGNTALTQTTSTAKLNLASDYKNINAASGFTINNGDFVEIFGIVDKNCSFDVSNMQIQIIEDLGYSYNGI